MTVCTGYLDQAAQKHGSTNMMFHEDFSWDTTPCEVTPVILHGVVSPERDEVARVRSAKSTSGI